MTIPGRFLYDNYLGASLPATDIWYSMMHSLVSLHFLIRNQKITKLSNIIAISGLGSHAFRSFEERDGDHMWLRDSLPYDLTREDTLNPMARVMVYGYESCVANSNSFQSLEDLATSFYNSLLALAYTPTTRPIIFIAHSLGGLIIKETLITLSKSKNEDNLKLVKAVYGIVFFGVPHDGMDISSLIPMVENGPNRFLVESINRINSQILSIQRREFHTALGGEGDSEIICFYETEESRTAQKDKHGNWTMRGPRACLVTKSSATRCRSWEDGPEHTCAIARTHSDMVKFSRQDHEYDKSRERLRGLARRALMAQHRKRSAGAKYYVNRSATWEKLKMQLGFDQRPGAADARQRVSLFGLGGVGKTQIAIAYVYWLREEFPDVSVFWVHASTEERFRQSYAWIAEECDIPGRDDRKLDLLMLVKAWLEKKLKAQWLMVIDNADDDQLFFPLQQNIAHRLNEKLGRYIPECAHGSILITTRNKKAGLRFAQGRPPIEVGNMTSDESSQLMRNILENGDIRDDEISGLATRLENLPLALTQAAAFIQENTISISRYIRLLDESNVALVDRLSEPFETVGRDSDTPHAVTATWIISFEQIEKQDRFTGEILSLISLFDRQAIPREFITYYWQKKMVSEVDKPSQEVRVTKALGTLKAFCFISEAKDESLNMHRLVQLVARKWLAIKGEMAEFAQQALRTVSSAFPYGEFETREVCLKYLPHAFAVLKNADTASKAGKKARARLLHNIAGYFDYEGHWEEAEQYGIGAVKLRIEIHGEEHPDTLTCMGNLVTIYLNQGRLKEAEELGVDVMKITKRVLGEEHPDTLISMGNLAATYWNQGRLKEAEELAVDVVKIRKRVLEEEHPSTLTSMGNLASTYWKQGRWKEAEELAVDVMEITKRVLGEEHPHTLTSMANLASTYRKQGRLKEAGELDVDVMKITKRVLGEEHPDTLMSMNNLASTYRKQGRLQEAEELDLDVMKITKRVLGEEHPHTLTSMANLASTYRKQGRLQEAEKLDIDVMKITKRVLGEEHPDTLMSMGNLASTYLQQGCWKDAEELQVIVMEKSKRVLGEEHPSTLTSMCNLASTYLNQGCLKEAEELQVDVMEIRKRVLGEEHPSTLTSMGNLAATYWNQGRLKEAEELEVDVMEIRKRVLGEEHPSTLTSMGNLAATYSQQGRWKDAEELEVDVMEIRKRVLGEEHPDTLTSMGNLASTYSQQGRWKDAEELEVDVMEIRKRVLREEHPSTR
ncbi:kinesin light chain 1 [Fusarium mexicanum]|uniref:Kinesin light chain 1 n=1 Tax=Fusarium mexicanum TaxID=751941 RepID=A0A8H5IAL3_9HYPO|nr:kinesin light chain 1 [Fusarium mexicanum]